MNRKVDIKLYRPEAYQKAVHKGLKLHWTDSIHIIKAVRQCGKSLMLVNILIKTSLEHKNQTSVVISPTYKQAKNIYNIIRKSFKGTPFLNNTNASDLTITFCNSSQIIFLSSEQKENIRGYSVTKHGILAIDEAAYISDEVFYTATPFVNASKAPIIVVSTPRFKTGFFYEFYQDGINQTDNIYSYDFTEYENPYLSKDKLEIYKRKMPLNLFRADYLGQWMELNSDVFGDLKSIIDNNPEQSRNNIMGVDWGVGKNAKSEESDYTVVSILNKKQQQLYIERWNDLDETETVKKIVQIAREQKVNKIICETNAIGSIYLGLLRKEVVKQHASIQIVEFNTNNTNKREIIQYFIVQVQNRTMTILDDPELKLEMSVLQQQKTNSGKITYNATQGYHDDCIIATALALEGMKTGNYAIR